MAQEGSLLQQYIRLQKALLSSLRLKDVLDATVLQFEEIAGGAKVAVFLSDNESMAFKLMAAKGYSDASLDQLRIVPFAAESLLKYVVQKRAPVSADNIQSAPDLSAALMQREGSVAQIGLPLISSNLLVGGVLMELNNAQLINYIEYYKDAAEVSAMCIANSILFGRSEYERERLSTLYKTSCALSGSVLKVSEVLQIAADTALILGNTPTCAILMLDHQDNVFKLAAFKGLDGSTLSEFDMGVRDTIAGSCLRNGRSEYIGGDGREPYGMPRATGGSPFHSALALPMIKDGQPIGVIMVFSTEQRAFHREQLELLESLTHQVTTALHIALTHESTAAQSISDVHTGLYNRVHFEDALLKEVERSARHRHEMALMLIDIDHFGQINDHLGQERGDEAIRHVAHTIKSTLRDIDIASRYGGEEFSVILPETPRQSAIEVAERLRTTIRNATAPGIGTITVSIGVAAYPSNAEDAPGLLRGCEQALDIAKFEGRDRVKEAQTGQFTNAGAIPWDELANQARLSVISERQSRLQSRLTVAPEYAAWMTKSAGLVKKRGTTENRIPALQPPNQ